jgi:hypothetical protein
MALLVLIRSARPAGIPREVLRVGLAESYWTAAGRQRTPRPASLQARQLLPDRHRSSWEGRDSRFDRWVCERLEVGTDPSTKLRSGNFLASITTEGNVLAIAGTGYGLIGLLIIILLVVLIVYFARRA